MPNRSFNAGGPVHRSFNAGGPVHRSFNAGERPLCPLKVIPLRCRILFIVILRQVCSGFGQRSYRDLSIQKGLFPFPARHVILRSDAGSH